MGCFDVHAHLTDPRLAPREAEVLANARAAGLTSILSNGVGPSDNERVRELAQRAPIVKPCFGFYPIQVNRLEMERGGIPYDFSKDGPPVTPEEGVRWVRDHVEEAFALGEIGLDGHWVGAEHPALWATQEAVFRQLVTLAMEADKAIIIHTRKRERRTLELLDELGARRVDWHCFGGKVELARAIAERGHHLSIPANARRSQSFTRMLETLPRERVLFETDCPYLGPVRDRDSEPADVVGTMRYAAELWGERVEDVIDRASEGFAALFGAPP